MKIAMTFKKKRIAGITFNTSGASTNNNDKLTITEKTTALPIVSSQENESPNILA
ncbi:hypothetical protein MH117_13950 [Paenibacillus sp. ACRRX]|uniref:hypothetical protein n=1 Tax=unclassified Paenibacillus TaxID=185978 RepID=UPI001EF6F984|nr:MULTISPECIES: hypothetical protein [unclassified Paenibacillus]MCG7408529.1 hypothetical protein [Paenibacillus sp. ACRRX]MDK8182777.1 hypothetical protein [Paenibacillus sp. UMB4589-SE434]